MFVVNQVLKSLPFANADQSLNTEAARKAESRQFTRHTTKNNSIRIQVYAGKSGLTFRVERFD
jgi:hypothetical protein